MQQTTLKVFQILSILIVLAAAVFYIMNFPILYSDLQQVCDSCTVTIQIQKELSLIGWTSNGYSLYLLLLSLSFTLGSVILGGLIFHKRPSEPMAILVAVTLASLGLILTITDSFYLAFPTISFIAKGISLITTVLFGMMLCYFPDFRSTPRWSHVLSLSYFIIVIIAHLPKDIQFWPDWLYYSLELIVLLAMGGTQVYRYRRTSAPTQKQQIKLPTFAFLIAVLLIIVSVQFPTNVLWGVFLADTLYFIALSFIPISFFLAIIRYKLWSIDSLINRTILYIVLTGTLLGIYGSVIFILGSTFQVESSTFISLMGTIVVVVLVQPLHRRLQMFINRIMYGDRQDPYVALVRLGNRLEATTTPELVLVAIVTSVRDALRLPYVSLVWPDGRIAAECGTPLPDLRCVDVLYQGERVADLVFKTREMEDEWSKEDRQIIHDLARQAGAAVHAVRLTQELQRSRQTLVTTREDERRRMRRDLHDGLGPEIAAFSFRVATARHLLRDDPNQADEILFALQNEIRNAVDLIRNLVHNLRPPVLDEYGLGEALAELVRRIRDNNIEAKLEIPVPLPILDAAVEVAAYRIVQEGLANVTRHAHASQVSLSLYVEGEFLLVILEDNGVGLPPIKRPGVGLKSMRERVEELGGRFTIVGRAEGGTIIRAELPFQNGGKSHATIAGSNC